MNIRYMALLLACATTLASAQPRQEIGTLVLDGVPAHSTRVAATLDKWLAGRSASFRDFLPDGSMLISTRFGDAEQIHRVERPLAAREQITFEAEPISLALANPTAAPGQFLYARDRGGDENAQLYLHDLASRSTRLLTDGKARHGGALWSRDGRLLAYQNNARNGINQDVYVLEVARSVPARLVVSSQGQTWQPLDWSPDGTRLLLLDYRSVTDADLYVADVAKGSTSRLPLPKSGIGSARFSADGRGVWFSADLGEEFLQLRYLDLAETKPRTLTADLPWDIDDFEVDPNGRYIAYIANVDGYSRLELRDLGSNTTRRPSGLPAGLISNLRFDARGTQLGLTIESATAPRDAWSYDIDKDAAQRWTRSESGPIDPERWQAAELVRYPTWDRIGKQQRQIPAFVYAPRGKGPHPVVIDIHGGPEGQSRPGYSPYTQYLVNELGYAVIQPNVRGSTGYGRTFTQLDNGRLREDSVRDIGALLVWIAANPQLDANRVVVMGGSYGGYMVLASLVHYGDRLRGGIDIVGISNFVTFLNNTSGYRRDLRRAEYGDERDPAMRTFLQRISPLNRAETIRKPLLVVQGLNDPRVPASESAQLVARVRGGGGDVWYLAAKDEGHGFRKKANRDFYLKTAATFLETLKE
jgi:dipeptidyl aminopeptidase/acylaminoacyl peptidase